MLQLELEQEHEGEAAVDLVHVLQSPQGRMNKKISSPVHQHHAISTPAWLSGNRRIAICNAKRQHRLSRYSTRCTFARYVDPLGSSIRCSSERAARRRQPSGAQLGEGRAARTTSNSSSAWKGGLMPTRPAGAIKRLQVKRQQGWEPRRRCSTSGQAEETSAVALAACVRHAAGVQAAFFFAGTHPAPG